MPLRNPAIEMDTDGCGTDGWSFAVLGAYDPLTKQYARREQGNDPLFKVDQTGAAFAPGVTYNLVMQHPVHCPVEQGVLVSFDSEGNPVYSSPAEMPVVALSPGTDVPIQLGPDAGPGDVLGLVVNADTHRLEVQSANLYAMLPDLRYGLGLGVLIEAAEEENTFDPAEFDPAEFDTQPT